MSAGVKKGDRVSIYMPMVVELVVAMLACVRIGAVHSIVVSLAREVVSDVWSRDFRRFTVCLVEELVFRVSLKKRLMGLTVDALSKASNNKSLELINQCFYLKLVKCHARQR